VLMDTPGQIEVFTWSASGSIITDMVASSFPTVLLFVIDTPRTQSPVTFMSNMLYACRYVLSTVRASSVACSPPRTRATDPARACCRMVPRCAASCTRRGCHSSLCSTKLMWRRTTLRLNGWRTLRLSKRRWMRSLPSPTSTSRALRAACHWHWMSSTRPSTR
ncbi:hypothetical protein EON66_08845, partial [archaeon]